MTSAKHRECGATAQSQRRTSVHASKTTEAQLGWQTLNGKNWAGWEVGSYVYDDVTGDWTVPCVDSSSPYTSDTSASVGLGGDSAQPLFQAGTYWDRYTRRWFAFFEEVPGPAATELAQVSCGDNISARVDYGQTCANESYFYVGDFSNGNYWSHCENFEPGYETAEWIAEASGCGGGKWWQMAKFSQYGFTYAQSGASLQYYPISYWNTEIRYYSTDPSGENMRAEPGYLGADGMSFGMNWHQYGTTTCY